MLAATLLAVFLVPVLYVAVDKLFGGKRKGKGRVDAELTTSAVAQSNQSGGHP
jgi:hypothetical protein